MRSRIETSDGGFTIEIGIDPPKHRSPLWFGIATLRPDTEPVSWDASDETYEGYYVTKGSITISWEGESSGKADVSAGECFYFSPEHKYTLTNPGGAEADFVWAVTPPPAVAND